MLEFEWLGGIGLAPAAGLDIADDCLTTLLDFDMLDSDLLLSLATVLVEGPKLARIERHHLMRMLVVKIARLECLARQGCAPQTIDCGKMGAAPLLHQHPLHAIRRLQAVGVLSRTNNPNMEGFVAYALVVPKELGQLICPRTDNGGIIDLKLLACLLVRHHLVNWRRLLLLGFLVGSLGFLRAHVGEWA